MRDQSLGSFHFSFPSAPGFHRDQSLGSFHFSFPSAPGFHRDQSLGSFHFSFPSAPGFHRDQSLGSFHFSFPSAPGFHRDQSLGSYVIFSMAPASGAVPAPTFPPETKRGAPRGQREGRSGAAAGGVLPGAGPGLAGASRALDFEGLLGMNLGGAHLEHISSCSQAFPGLPCSIWGFSGLMIPCFPY